MFIISVLLFCSNQFAYPLWNVGNQFMFMNKKEVLYALYCVLTFTTAWYKLSIV